MIIGAIWACFLSFKLGALFAIPGFLILIVVASSELTTGFSVWRSELGGWRGIITTLMFVVLARVAMLFFGFGEVFRSTRGSISIVFELSLGNILFWLNLVLLVGEAATFVYLYRHSEFFMLREEARKQTMSEAVAKTVSECPNCQEVVESYWQSCPYCGTRLPRTCVDCGHDLGDMLMKCPHCGKEVMQSAALRKTIETFEMMAKEDVLPETKATRYARLAEALLKNGDTKEAIDAYRMAIQYTKFPRKRTNFMVQAARILKNTGNEKEALRLLDEALALDSKDIAGAGKLKAEIQTSPA